MADPVTYNMAPVAPAAAPHAVLAYVGDAPDRAAVRQVALQLTNYYLQRDFSRNRWRREPATICRWEARVRNADGTITGTPRTSVAFNLNDVERHLSARSTFNFGDFGLPDPMCRWLDSSLMMASGFHAPANAGAHALTLCAEPNLGHRFPLVPTLDREGTAYTSFQTILLRRITSLRSSLVLRSTEPHAEEWFQDFRSLISECVALIENTLHQAYFKAQYDPLPGWIFDQVALGERHGRRVVDKVRWIYQITHVRLNAGAEMRGFVRIKDLRNHLLHFGPPSFACTWEEMADWLNAVLGVARLAWKIRKCLGALPSTHLIELLLQRRVRFAARDPARRRVVPPRYVGYASTSGAALAAGTRPQIEHETILMQAPPEPRLLP